MEWLAYPIESFCSTGSGGTPSRTQISKYYNGEIPWVKSGELNENIITDTEEKINKVALKESSAKLVPKDSILIALYGATVGRTAILGVEAATNQAVCFIIPNKKIVYYRYLWYALRTKVPELLLKKVGGAQPNISQQIIKKTLISIPPLSEQQRIIEILDQADEIRKLRKQADEKAEKIIPALFYKMFGDPVTYNGKLKIIDVVKKVEQKDFRKLPEYEFKYVDISSVDGTKGKIVAFSNYIGSKAPSRAKQIVKTNDVIVSTVRPYLKATALMPEEFDNQVCSTGFCVLRTKENYGHGFLYALSRLDWFSNKLMSMARGASYPAVSDSDVLGLKIPYPLENQSLVKKFDNIILNLEQKRNLRKRSTERITDLFEILLSKAFDGSLTSSWREANMKELLKEMEEQKKYLERVN